MILKLWMVRIWQMFGWMTERSMEGELVAPRKSFPRNATFCSESMKCELKEVTQRSLSNLHLKLNKLFFGQISFGGELTFEFQYFA